MSIRFDSLSLKNFGPYKDIRDLNLATRPESPIVVIHGENTMGKTRFFRALRWCLYASPELNVSPSAAMLTLRQYMNRIAVADGEEEMEVAIKFTADNHQYQLTRTARFEANRPPKVTVNLRIDSQVIQQAGVEAEIGRLLHPQISEFFLFDGELLGQFYDRLNESSEHELLQSSIENVLGIPALQLAERDVSILTDDALQRQTKALKNQAESDKAKKDLLDLKSRQESLEKDRKELQASLLKAEDNLEDVQQQIASVEELKADAREMETLEALIKGDETEVNQLRETMKNILTTGWLAPVAGKLNKSLADVVASNDLAELRQVEIRAARARVNVLEKQIQGGTCPTCRQELPPADAATQQSLADAETDLQHLIGNAGQEPNLRLERQIRGLIDTTTTRSYQDKQNQLDKINRAQFDRNRRLNTIKDRLKDNDASMIRQLANQQQKLESAIETFQDKLTALQSRQAVVNTQQNKVATQLRRLSGTQPALQAEALFFTYVRTVLDNTIRQYRERTRAEVERTASATFLKLIRDADRYRGLRISPNYRVELIGENGEPMNTSEGGRQLVALSLIGALKRAAVRGGPVVLDSPLGRLDTLHRENVLQKWVPELGSQAILLVQSGEIDEKEAGDIMGNTIGHEYRIHRPNNDPNEATIERTR